MTASERKKEQSYLMSIVNRYTELVAMEHRTVVQDMECKKLWETLMKRTQVEK